MGFGIPSTATGGDTSEATNSDDRFRRAGLPEDLPTTPLGVFDLVCSGPKDINADSGYQGMALEFKIVNDDNFTGEKVSLMAPYLDTVSAAKRRGAIRQWRRIASALKIMGLGVGTDGAPIAGWDATKGVECRGAVGEYNGNPSLVWNKPSQKFPAEYQNDEGKYRDYGCGILPVSE